MYEAVQAHPDGESTVRRLALTASEYGFDGIVVRNHGDEPASYDPGAIGDTYGIDVVPGVEVRAPDPSRASGLLSTHRNSKTVVLVHGGSPEINRFAVEQPAVDVLAHPMAGRGEFDHVLAREAAKNGVRVEVCLRRVLRSDGGRRVDALEDLRKLGDLIEYYDTQYVASGAPRSHLELRDPRGLSALGDTLGMGADWIEAGLTEWGRIAERNRVRQSEGFIENGVRQRGSGEESTSNAE